MNLTGPGRPLGLRNKGATFLLFLAVLMVSVIPAFAALAVADTATTTLIAKNSTWKYNDSNTDLGTAWRAESYDDSAWKSGKGPLGYPTGDTNPTFGKISAGTLVANQSKPNAYITYYFRSTFEVADKASISKLDLTVGIDDGYVMYINGQEVRRLYMPDGEPSWQTFANFVNEPSDDTGTDTADITAAAKPLLKNGTNTIAVEVHNRDHDSSDIYFDLQLTATTETVTSYDVTAGIKTGLDDTEEFLASGLVDDGSSDLEMCVEKPDSADEKPQIIAVRFADLGIPQGAVITSAYIQFTADQDDDAEEKSVNPFSVNIFAEDQADSAPIQTTAYNISSRTKTADSVTWSLDGDDTKWAVLESGPKQKTPDLTGLMQQIVDKPAWSIGNAMTFLITGNSGCRPAVASEDGPGAKLVVTFDYAGVLPQAAPTGLTGVAPTTAGGSDGQITGVTAAMEYKLSSGSAWTACTGTTITGLDAGAYDVRYAAKEGYNASPATAVTVPEPAVAWSSTLIARASDWTYNDTNTDQGTAWQAEGFDDSSWKTGKGPLGYPASDSQPGFGAISSGTLVDNQGAGNAYITYYFRKAIDITAADLAKIQKLTATVARDDGFVMYINGTEVWRVNMPEGSIGWQTVSAANDDGVDSKNLASVALPLLKVGANTIAVEVHNRDNNSSDIYFDKELVASSADPAPAGATVSSIVLGVGTHENERTFTWYSDSDNAGVLQASYAEFMTGDEFPSTPGMYLEFPATRAATAIDGVNSFRVTVPGLESNSDYVYRAGNADGWSDSYALSTQALGDSSFSFLFAGDPQIGSSGNVTSDTSGWTTTLNKAASWFPNVDFLVNLGDQVDHAANETEYAGLLAPEVLRSLTIANNIGNHDSGAVNYSQHFTVPNESATLGVTNAGGDYWYSYEGVLFMGINSNDRSTAEHKQFLQEAIAAYKAQNGGEDPLWKIVTFHHSPYSTASHTNDGDIVQRRNELPPVFEELGIDAVLTGHDHSYARSLMMEGTDPITTGYTADGTNQYASYVEDPAINETVYFSTNSASGSKYYNLKNTTFPFLAVHNQEKVPNIAKADVSVNQIIFTTYRTGADNVIGDVVDTFTLIRLENQAAPTGLAGVAPTTIANSDGKITGVGEGMEYKLSGEEAYAPVAGSEITDLVPGAYLVRYAAKEGFHASAPAEVTVPAFDGLAVNIGAEQKSGSAYKRVISAEQSGNLKLEGKFLVVKFTEKAGKHGRSWSMVIPAVPETAVFYYKSGTKVEAWITDGVPAVPGQNKDVEVFAYTKSDVPVKSVSLNNCDVKLNAGQKKVLTACIQPFDASNKAVTWTSSNAAVATVDDDGLVTAVAPGKATITVTTQDGGKTARCAVTVMTPVKVTGVRLTPDKDITIKIGQKGNLNAVVSPGNATNKGVTWSSSNSSIVSVDQDGKYTGLKTGTATITVKTDGGGKTDTVKITVKAR